MTISVKRTADSAGFVPPSSATGTNTVKRVEKARVGDCCGICNRRVQVVIRCSLCVKIFCGIHRHLEQHGCPELEAKKTALRAELANRLTSGGVKEFDDTKFPEGDGGCSA